MHHYPPPSLLSRLDSFGTLVYGVIWVGSTVKSLWHFDLRSVGWRRIFCFRYWHLRKDAVVLEFEVVQQAQCSRVFDFVNKLSIPSFLNTLNCPFRVFDPSLSLPQNNRIKETQRVFGYLKELPGHNHEGTGVLFTVIWLIYIFIYLWRKVACFVYLSH